MEEIRSKIVEQSESLVSLLYALANELDGAEDSDALRGVVTLNVEANLVMLDKLAGEAA